jgi:hypothetical protein
MFADLISVAVALGGGGMIALAIKQARGKGWAGSLQMAAGGFLLIGAAAIGLVGFFADMVFNPLAWLGVVALGVAAALFAVGQRLEGRSGIGGQRAVGKTPEGSERSANEDEPRAVEGKRQKPNVDDDLSEIEEILRRHGIE